MSRSAQRVQLTRAYVLHQRPFRDSSLIAEVFAREYGRMTVFARAARGPRSRFAALPPFRMLLLSWSGRGLGPPLPGAEGADALEPTPRAGLKRRAHDRRRTGWPGRRRGPARALCAADLGRHPRCAVQRWAAASN